MSGHRVAVIGGGASGLLTALNLLAAPGGDGLRVTVHERSGIVGRGVAYGTTDARHLLNVRARHMSAFPHAPGDLLEWARRNGRAHDPQGFLPRADYGLYLQDRLADVADDRLRIRAGEVLDVIGEGTGFEVVTEHDHSHADSVVLAHGHEPPRPLRVDGHELPGAPWHLANPWDLGRLRLLGPRARVLLVGSGLTAVDVATTLLGDSPERTVTMTSRHGRLPTAHVAQQHTAWVTAVPEGPLTVASLADSLREQAAAAARADVDWRVVVDGLRPRTQEVWQRLPEGERRLFLERHAREWEVRRHRMAPDVAAEIHGHRARERLHVLRGTLEAVDDLGQTCRVTLGGAPRPLEVDAVVNCTGPSTDLAAATSPLLRALRDRGTLAPDPLALGLHATPTGQVLDISGAVVPGLHVVGPALKGALWEATAIPEIRQQAAAVAAMVVRAAHLQERPLAAAPSS